MSPATRSAASLLEALDDLEAALKLAPRRPEPRADAVARARVKLDLTKYKEAHADAGQVAPLDPRHRRRCGAHHGGGGPTALGLPRVAGRMRPIHVADASYRRHLRVEPGPRLRAHGRLGQGDRRRRSRARLLGRVPGGAAGQGLDRVLPRSRRRTGRRDSHAGDRAGPDGPALRVLRAQVRTKLRSFDDAIRDCDEAAKRCFLLDPHIARIQAKLARDRWAYIGERVADGQVADGRGHRGCVQNRRPRDRGRMGPARDAASPSKTNSRMP